MPWRGPEREDEFPSLGWEVLEWLEQLPSPRDAMKPLRFTDEQAMQLVEWFAIDPVRDRLLHRRGYSRRSKGWGKALALDTPLPTPDGWVLMGDVGVGDVLIDEQGVDTTVTALSEVMAGRSCYRVEFRDGSSVVADGDHLWPMDEFVGGRSRRRVDVTTREMFVKGIRFDRKLTKGSTKALRGGVARWRTLPTPCLPGADIEFAVPPYLLGYWLIRKAERLRRRPISVPYSQVRTVTSITEVSSVPVRCVSVSGRSSLYLAGEGMVPTHNSPVEAAKVVAELAGPVRFDGWDANGDPVGRPWGGPGDPQPWVQVGAVAEDQTDNTWSVVYYFLTENDGKVADELGIDAGLTRCYLRNRPGAKLEPVTASAGTREGQPITYACLDETHLWTPRNGGTKLARTMRRNVAKMDGRSYETTNSFVRGERSVAEESYKAVRAGAAGVFADEAEAPDEVDGVVVDLEATDAVLREALKVAYGDSWWADIGRLVDDIRDPDSDWEESCRFFFNWNRDKEREADAGPIENFDRLARVNVEYEFATVSLAVDVAYDRSWTTLGAVGTSLDGLAQCRIIAMKPGWAWAPERIKHYSDELGGVPVAMAKDEPLIDAVEVLGVTVVQMSGTEQAQASQKFIDACFGDAPMLRHRGEPALAKALSIAVTKAYGDGNTDFSRKHSPGDISPLKALTMAFGRLGEVGSGISAYEDDGLMTV